MIAQDIAGSHAVEQVKQVVVQVTRAYLRCEGCGARSYPADEWLGRQDGFSHLLQEAVAWQAAAMPGALWAQEALKPGLFMIISNHVQDAQ